MALSTHDPGTRSSLALDWLNRNAMACSLEKLTLINANRASWMGTSDSHLIAGILDSMMEFKIAGKPEMLAQIFGSLGKEGVAGVHMVVASPVPRAEPQPTYGTPYPPQPGYPQAAYPPHYQPQPAYPQATYPQPNPEGR